MHIFKIRGFYHYKTTYGILFQQGDENMEGEEKVKIEYGTQDLKEILEDYIKQKFIEMLNEKEI